MIQRFLRQALFALLLAGLLPQSAWALDLPQGVTEVNAVEGITEYRLANGLRVLLFPDPSKPTVTVNITYLVGSRHEGYGETGMAHLLEHLLFKGTPTHQDIPGEMKRRGIRFNATTWLDRTNYFADFTGDGDTLDWLLGLEADRMRHSNVARGDLDSEMTVVRNEMEAGDNNPVQVLMARITSSAYLWHNYGNSTIGARADVENMPIERLQAFYRRHYRPDNATLLVAGRIDPADALVRISRHFGAIEAPQEALIPTYTREPAQDGEREVTVRRVGETRYLGTLYHAPAGRHSDAAALAVLADVLGNTPSGRLHKGLVEGKLATLVGEASYGLAEPGFLMFLAEAPKDGDFAVLEQQMLALVEQIAARPITDEEVADAKRRFAKAVDLTINDANRLANALSESIAQGDWRLFFLDRDRVEAVTSADVNRVAAAYLKRSNRTLGRFLPTAEPDRVEITEAAPASELVDGYQGREPVAAGEAFDASPANIDQRSQTSQLSNGTTLVLLPKRTRGSTVVLNMNLRFGDEAAVLGKDQAASFVASMLTRGSSRLSREAIARRLDELNAQLSISGGAQGVTVSARSTREHLPALIELIAELLKSPAFPEAEFEQLRSQAITSVESATTEPQAIALNAMNRHMNAHWPVGHPQHEETFEQQIAGLRALELAQLRDFHAAFYGAGDGEIALLGDFDAEAVQAQLEQQFGDWTRATPFVRIADPYLAIDPVQQHLETPDKPNAMVLLVAELAMADSDPDYPAMLVGNYIFGGGSLKSRLADRIRQRDGLSYGVGAQFSAHPIDQHASVLSYAIAAPENVAKVEAAFNEELATLLRDGISAAELQDAVDGLLKSNQQARGEDASLVGQLRNNAYLGRSMAWIAQLEQQLRELDVDTVNAALRKHLGSAQFSLFAAGDFGKLKAE